MNELTVETKLNDLKMMYKDKKMTESEIMTLHQMSEATGLNPFLKEIWITEGYGGGPAQIFIGRDGYRKAAQSQEEYDWHRAESVYSNDNFEVVDGVIKHSYGFANRGALQGAYCIVQRRHSSKEMFVIVQLSEYDKKRSTWNSMKETMIKKTAEAQALRQAFQGVFSGTYSEFEFADGGKPEPKQEPIEAEKLDRIVEIVKEDITPIKLLSDEQKQEIFLLMMEVDLSPDRQMKAFNQYGISTLDELNEQQADRFIKRLKEIKAERDEQNK